MAGSVNPEHCINAFISIASQASGGLADEISTINTEWGDNITIHAPTDYYRGPLRSVPLQEDKPIIFVEADISEFPDRYRGENQQGSAVRGGYNIQYHTIQVGVLIRGRERLSYQSRTIEPTEVLNIRIYRTMDAVQTLIEANKDLTFSGTKNCDRVQVENIAYPYIQGVPGNSELFEKRGLLTMLTMISP